MGKKVEVIKIKAVRSKPKPPFATILVVVTLIIAGVILVLPALSKEFAKHQVTTSESGRMPQQQDFEGYVPRSWEAKGVQWLCDPASIDVNELGNLIYKYHCSISSLSFYSNALQTDVKVYGDRTISTVEHYIGQCLNYTIHTGWWFWRRDIPVYYSCDNTRVGRDVTEGDQVAEVLQEATEYICGSWEYDLTLIWDGYSFQRP